MRVAVLTGGLSSEREISFGSGREVVWAMEQLGYQFQAFDIADDFYRDLVDYSPDVAFMALLGGTGENGSIQGMMEVMRLPYTHSGVAAAAAAMNKEMAKSIFRDAGLPVPEGGLYHRDEIQRTHVMDTPYVVKPNDDGSSLGGVFVVRNHDTPPPNLEGSRREIYLVEEFIPGRELTTSVLGDGVLATSQFDIEGVYDYEQKYQHLDHNRILPAPLPAEIEDFVSDIVKRAHDELGCRGLTRTDLRWDESRGVDGVKILELNALPGLRRNSISGEHAAYRGIEFPELCNWLIEDASLDR